MSTTDTSGKGLETLIMRRTTGVDGLEADKADGVVAAMMGGIRWWSVSRSFSSATILPLAWNGFADCR